MYTVDTIQQILINRPCEIPELIENIRQEVQATNFYKVRRHSKKA